MARKRHPPGHGPSRALLYFGFLGLAASLLGRELGGWAGLLLVNVGTVVTVWGGLVFAAEFVAGRRGRRDD